MNIQQTKIENNENNIASNYFNWGVLCLTIIYLAINHEVLEDLYHKWFAQELSGAYSHGLLIAIIVLYIVYKKILENRSSLRIQPSLTGFFLLLISQLFLFVSIIIDINFLQHIFLVATIFALVWSLYSYNIAKLFYQPVILFSLAFPFWGELEYPLQKISVFLTNILLIFTGLPFYHINEYFYFPNGIIEIAPACSGLQQLLVSLIVGLLFAMQRRLSIFDTAKTLIYLSIVAVFVNSIRILIIMVVGYFTKMESSLISQHLILGWVIYGIGIYVFLFFYSRMKFKTVTHDAIKNINSSSMPFTRSKKIKYLIISAFLLVSPGILIPLITGNINSGKIIPVSLEITGGEWRKVSDNLGINWKPDYPVADSEIVGEYTKKNISIYVSASKYERLKNNIEPVNMENKPYNNKYWSPTEHEELSVENADKRVDKLLFDRLESKNNEHLDVLTYFIVNGKVADNIVKAKLLTLFGIIKLKYDIKVVCLAMKSNLAQKESKTSLIDFYKNIKVY